MGNLFDAFISYGRADSKAFATKLHAHLLEQGLNVWFDQNDIPLGVDFQNQIDDGIEKAHNFLFLIAPHSINSPYCGKEIELALKRNKRIIPLLHVEQITQETWQQRFPTGTVEDWEAYRQKGLHSSFPNMHPAIGKINWVYFREGVDDFETSFTGLMSLLSRHRDYVEAHTQFLAKALEWERNQKQTSYLLIGEERQQAEAWLKIRFRDEQPPCTPTNLHCEYITESIKNAHNLMTQVFLSYADEDRATMEKIRNSLRRESITVWTNKTDIQTGEAFEEAIKRGIEQADNLVFLLSPESVNSTYCQQELDLALSLSKRIIPILVRETDLNQVPSALRSLQYIDLTDNVQEDDYLLDESQLLKIFHQDAAYYNEHKILLAKALKWKRQHENPSILLRGYNLRSAETWLKVAKKRTQQPPTLLQEEFIEESLRQLPLESLDVFVSYSRADSDFARKLNDSLQIQGKTTWFDQESIASGSDFQQEIYRGIKACNNFLFILSPRSVNSPYCADEVEYAAGLNKRFVTVLHQEINSCDLHPELAKVQWIDFNHNERDFNANFNQLVRTLDTDRVHVYSHTKWLQRSLEWKQKDKSTDLLLRGSEFLIAQNWLQETEQQQKKPVATVLQKEFIEASKNAIVAAEKEETRRQSEMLRLQEERTKEAEARLALQKKSAKRQKYFLVAVTTALMAAVGFSVVAVNATRKAQAAQAKLINALTYSIESRLNNYQDFDALIESIRTGRQLQTLEAQDKRKIQQRVKDVWQKAFYRIKEIHRFVGHDGAVLSLSFSPDGKTIVSGGGDGTIKLWERSGRLLFSIKRHEREISSIRFSPDGQSIASASADGTIKLWNLKGQPLHTLEGHEGMVTSVSFSPDGQTLASAGEDGTIRLWNQEGKQIKTWQGHTGRVNTVAFSPDGQRIASGGSDKDNTNNTVRLWDGNGKLLQTFTGHQIVVREVNFSPDGQTIISASEDHSARLWSITGEELQQFVHSEGVIGANFSPDGQTILTSSFDKTIKLWNLAGQEIRTIRGHQDWVNEATYSPDGQTIASASSDGTVRLWDSTSSILHQFSNHTDSVYSVHYSPDGKLLASAGNDGKINLYDSKGEFIRGFPAHTEPIGSVQFSPDGKTLASASGDNTIKLWDLSGQPINTLDEHEKPITAVRFSPDGQTIASASEDNTVKLWNRQGQLLRTFEGHKGAITNLSFSPDGQTLASASADQTVKLWSLTGQILHTLQGHQNIVRNVIFSPDGQTIVSTGGDRTIRFWTRTGQLLKIARGHTASVNSLSFSRDGKLLVSAGEDNTLRVWTASGEPLQILDGHTNWVNDISFSPEGTTVASASDDQTIIIWNLRSSKVGNQLAGGLSLDQLLTKSCAWVSNYLQHNPTLDKSDRVLCDGIDH
ncbi:TIR domain-containing protein [Allocoleopsis franciscana]|uniref:WD40 repeat-containing protein n=1 Tax=Allocoleopsis franciscana PCC 7113 TaxID=1173027 RepID=K9WQJ2_9CYAN|nr:TIR domain-containing protein [Allocoleopsis franciscana]AFZ21832.1 WD40 repeat-containing protein [Allocoleopsis franciscana PCC 7113]